MKKKKKTFFVNKLYIPSVPTLSKAFANDYYPFSIFILFIYFMYMKISIKKTNINFHIDIEGQIFINKNILLR
jgi:hypothetical protein